MYLNSSQLNKERLHGNKLFLHNFKNFSTTSARLSLKIYIVHSLLFILLIVLSIYIVLVISIIFNIINKKESLAKINDINFQIAKVEKDYNLVIEDITKEKVLASGFVESKDNYFVARKDAASSLSFLYENKLKK